MADLPATCPSCKIHFPVANPVAGNVRKQIMMGNRATCPKCGGLAIMHDGEFELRENQLIFIDGPPLTATVLKDLERIASKATAGELTADEILAEVAGVSPELAKKLRSKGLGPLVLIIILVWLVQSCTLNITVDINELIDQANGAAQSKSIEQVRDDPPPLPAINEFGSPNASLAKQLPTKESRQVKRHRERLARKREHKI
ncbi:hypothetical protein [Qipengyuania flava]|uniref:hypothetical protein n=1 Tax=Qipengyuania flava TaxID=192812 RepID=UPI00273FF62C|nr:hypothetical protein [Qipengyuania flava]